MKAGDSINSFLVESQTIPVVDRSTLEGFARCPAQAIAIERGLVQGGSAAADAGEEVHQAISLTIREYIDAQGMMGQRDLVDFLRASLFNSRPDVQEEAVQGCVRSVWDICSWIAQHVHYGNVLCWDGGEGEQSGQLTKAYDHVHVTSELDMLHAGPGSPGRLYEIDWKSGRKQWSPSDIASSFQFQMHALLVFENYPECVELQVRVWNTRSNAVTQPVVFERRYLDQYESRVLEAAKFWRDYHDLEIADAPAWPDLDKCCMCDAAHLCPEACQLARELSENPAEILRRYITVSAAEEFLRKALTKHVDQHGPVSWESTAFGRKESSRKPTAKLYHIGSEDNDD